MGDRLVRVSWWTLVMGFIGMASLGAMYAGYWGVGELLARRWTPGGVALAVGVALAAATCLTCRHRNDLLYS